MSTTVEFPDTKIHLAYDNATFVSLKVSVESVHRQRHGEIRAYASGRRAAVIYPDTSEPVEFRFSFVDRASIDQLVEWVGNGEPLMIRDQRGRKVYGHVFSIDISETPFNANVVSGSFRIEPVHYDEAV